jgi:hypothetical protein
MPDLLWNECSNRVIVTEASALCQTLRSFRECFVELPGRTGPYSPVHLSGSKKTRFVFFTWGT